MFFIVRRNIYGILSSRAIYLKEELAYSGHSEIYIKIVAVYFHSDRNVGFQNSWSGMFANM